MALVLQRNALLLPPLVRTFRTRLEDLHRHAHLVYCAGSNNAPTGGASANDRSFIPRQSRCATEACACREIQASDLEPPVLLLSGHRSASRLPEGSRAAHPA